jgi:site-specific recombinase XerD
MTDQAMSPLRRRMIEDMTIRKLAPKTQQGYIRIIRDFAAFLGRSPATASFEDVRRFQLHLAASGAHIPILNHTVAALRFFFRVTLRRSDIIEHTTFNRVADQTVTPANPYVSNNLLPNAFIKNDEILVFCINKSHQARPGFNPDVSL